MSLNISSQLAHAIAAQGGGEKNGFFGPQAAATDQRPVLQLNALPMTLAPSAYANAHSSANPGGSYSTLNAFSELADSVPVFSEYYSPSLNTVSAVYSNLLRGASVKADAPYAGTVIAKALQNVASGGFSNLDGTPGLWYPVYAIPGDWYDTGDPDRFSDITLDLTGEGKDDSGPYRILEESKNSIAANLIRIGKGDAVQIDPASALKRVTLKYLEVQLNRPWLDFEVFNLGGWFIGGLDAGYFSDGSIDNNQGVMPLITTSLLVAINVDLAADWSAKDQQFIDDTRRQGDGVAVGPFAINAAASTDLHVIGWVSRLVPLAPQIDAGH
ncbi:hypothetical protein INH39_01405 [Massilia violaceinigra]|uniref:Uncharacterized protein n=1 Tax=Massilia violaceinigra TaxID=2045208 RepID=A0ABY4A6N1_9BURK|nr:hypothetical protein [Massilia violaceinigra]UOD30441.1 hypothetical protein INH39_01405 [Massilia violaceinigra]